MYFDSLIKIPCEKGKIITKKKGSSTYVLYQYGQVYNAEKKYTVPQRAIIGKLSAENPDMMYPNEKFQEYFSSVQLPEELPETFRSCALKIGSYAVIQKIMNEYGLPQKLQKQFGDNAGLLMDLVSYLLIEEENAGQYYPDYAYDHPLFSKEMHIYSDSKICRFLKSFSREQMIGFLDDWNKARDHKQRIYISYDSTNKNCHAGDIDIVEYGKAKIDVGAPIFNLAVAYDKTNRVPLFYEDYPGSINDVSQFSCMVDKVIQYGYKNVGFILDRGYFSKDNIRYMESNNYAFIIMVKGQKDLVSSLIEQNLHTFETDRDCSIRSYRMYGKTVTSRLYEDDKKEYQFHIYFSTSRQSAEREVFEQELDRMKLAIEKQTGTQTTFGKHYEKYFNLTYDKKGTLLSYKENKDVIERTLNLCGYFCIITSEKMTASQALIHYKGRDISEKLFGADKSFIGSKSMRVQTQESLKAKLFIEFIALIVRNRLYNLLKETVLRINTSANYMTVPASLRELEKIEMVRRNNGRYRLDHAVTKRQKIILSAFGMDDESIRGIADTIEIQLAEIKESSNIETDDKEDNENGTNPLDYFD